MTDRVIRALDLAGLPVVAVDSGEDIAEIKDVVFDGTQHQLVGFTLNKRGWFRGKLRQQLPTASILAIGPDAIMVESEDDLRQPENAPDALTGDAEVYDVADSRVLSSDGTDLGVVSGVVLSTGSLPRAVGYEVTGADNDAHFVPISAQMALSNNNLLIPAEATAFIRNDLAGFGAAVNEYRASLDDASTGASS